MFDDVESQMPNHATALVSTEAWAYQSLDLHLQGQPIDIGLFAESLLYYDTVLLQVQTQPQLAEFVRWFARQDQIGTLIGLLEEATIRFYDYAFASIPVLRDGKFIFLNIQDPVQSAPGTFPTRFLEHSDVRAVFSSDQIHKRFVKAGASRAIEVRADAFGSSIENARTDHTNSRRSALVVQSFLDEFYRIRELGKPPKVESRITLQGSDSQIQYNVDFGSIECIAGGDFRFSPSVPLAGSVVSNRLLWSAAMEKCDLYLSSPMASLIGDKLFEANHRIVRAKTIISSLQSEVEFPDIRAMVNAGKLPIQEVLRIREKAQPFRTWLQSESDRDRNALFAYHSEVSKKSGLSGLGRKILRIGGVIGAGAVGGAIGSAVDGPAMAAAAGALAGGVGYLVDLVTQLEAEWKPVLFGNWLNDRIATYVDE